MVFGSSKSQTDHTYTCRQVNKSQNHINQWKNGQICSTGHRKVQHEIHILIQALFVCLVHKEYESMINALNHKAFQINNNREDDFHSKYIINDQN